MQLIPILIISLCLTILSEWFFAFVCGLRESAEFLLILAVNLLTNPAVVLLHTFTATHFLPALTPATVVLEILAIIIEWLCYRKFSRQLSHPFYFALSANLFSYGFGCIINSL